MKISGTFDVKMTPLESSVAGADGVALNRFSLDKKFHGDLDGISKGEMFSAMTPVKGSAGYVAIEQMQGTLAGKKGSFVLQHFGTMTQDGSHLILEVVPNSGTGDLVGLSGTMSITIEHGQHFYEFDYELT